MTTSIRSLREGSRVKEWTVDKGPDALLGAGNYGEVWRARHRLGMPVAIKSFARLASMVRQDRLIREIVREAIAQARVDHENVVHLIDADENRGCLVCELLPTNLEKLCKAKKKDEWFKYEEALVIFRSILEGLQAVHNNDIVHGDLKPANILMTEKLNPKISDFGMASILSVKKFPTSFLRGSNSWAAPEVLQGERADYQSDLFSVGIIGFLLFTSVHPFHREDPSCLSSPEDCIRDSNYSVAHARDIDDNVPDVLSEILDKLLERDLIKRYKNVEEVLMSLSELEEPIAPTGPVEIDVGNIAEAVIEAKRLFRIDYDPWGAIAVLDEITSKCEGQEVRYLANAYWYKAFVHNYLRQWDFAIEATTKGIALDPSHCASYLTRGFAYHHRALEIGEEKELDKALVDLNKAKILATEYKTRLQAQRYIDQVSYASDNMKANKSKVFISETEDIDTVVVPSPTDAFKENFLGNNCWYGNRIAKSRLEKIKYIAAYQPAPISAVTHYAQVSTIQEDGDTDKLIICFTEPAKEIEPIKLVPSSEGGQVKAPSGPRYTTLLRLMEARTLDELFQK